MTTAPLAQISQPLRRMERCVAYSVGGMRWGASLRARRRDFGLRPAGMESVIIAPQSIAELCQLLWQAAPILECGGKRSATPLCIRRTCGRSAASRPSGGSKAPSPLRSAGALQNLNAGALTVLYTYVRGLPALPRNSETKPNRNENAHQESVCPAGADGLFLLRT
jgi:hypothetical protein